MALAGGGLEVKEDTKNRSPKNRSKVFVPLSLRLCKVSARRVFKSTVVVVATSVAEVRIVILIIMVVVVVVVVLVAVTTTTT